MLLKAVLFDIDDTLFDREAAQKLTLQMMIEKHPDLLGRLAPPILQAAWQQSDDLSTTDFIKGTFTRVVRCRHFLRLLNLPTEYAELMTRQYLSDYTQLNVPLAGALQLVRSLKKQCKVGVVSNSLADVQYAKLRTLEMHDLMSCIVLSEELGIRKPDPAVFHHAARLLQVASSDCLFVGDSFSADIVGAKSAGMLACWLKGRGTTLPDHPMVRPDYTIQALSELIPLLKDDGLLS